MAARISQQRSLFDKEGNLTKRLCLLIAISGQSFVRWVLLGVLGSDRLGARVIPHPHGRPLAGFSFSLLVGSHRLRYTASIKGVRHETPCNRRRPSDRTGHAFPGGPSGGRGGRLLAWRLPVFWGPDANTGHC